MAMYTKRVDSLVTDFLAMGLVEQVRTQTQHDNAKALHHHHRLAASPAKEPPGRSDKRE